MPRDDAAVAASAATAARQPPRAEAPFRDGCSRRWLRDVIIFTSRGRLLQNTGGAAACAY